MMVGDEIIMSDIFQVLVLPELQGLNYVSYMHVFTIAGVTAEQVECFTQLVSSSRNFTLILAFAPNSIFSKSSNLSAPHQNV